MKRKIISVFLALFGLGIIGYTILYFLGLFKSQDSGVLIESNLQSTVYINSIEVGTTPFETNMAPDIVSIKIKPLDQSKIYDEYETRIKLVSGVRTIIKRDFDENEDYTSGAVVSFEKIGSQDSFLTVVSIPDKIQVRVDEKYYGNSPLRIPLVAGDHKLKVSLDGYEEKEFDIKVYKGYKLTAAIKLAKIKNINNENVVIEDQIKKFSQIKINKNQVGFLRVRSGASTGFPEVGQVKPDEVYDILEEGEHGKWFKIKFGEVSGAWPVAPVEGWVSGEFVTKI